MSPKDTLECHEAVQAIVLEDIEERVGALLLTITTPIISTDWSSWDRETFAAILCLEEKLGNMVRPTYRGLLSLKNLYDLEDANYLLARLVYTANALLAAISKLAITVRRMGVSESLALTRAVQELAMTLHLLERLYVTGRLLEQFVVSSLEATSVILTGSRKPFSYYLFQDLGAPSVSGLMEVLGKEKAAFLIASVIDSTLNLYTGHPIRHFIGSMAIQGISQLSLMILTGKLNFQWCSAFWIATHYKCLRREALPISLQELSTSLQVITQNTFMDVWDCSTKLSFDV